MPSDNRPVIFWFRRDLRLRDNPALHWASKLGRPVICIFILDDSASDWKPGGASRWWLHHSIDALQQDLKSAGNRLRLFAGNTTEALETIVNETDAGALAWNRRYEPESIELDKNIKAYYK